MKTVLIYKPAKNAMQSGRALTGEWVLEYPREVARRPEPVMGWTAADDTKNQVRLFFRTADEAVAFARTNGWLYTLDSAHERKVTPRNYTDNFRYVPPADNA